MKRYEKIDLAELAPIIFNDETQELFVEMRKDNADPADVYFIGYYECIRDLLDPAKREIIERHVEQIRK